MKKLVNGIEMDMTSQELAQKELDMQQYENEKVNLKLEQLRIIRNGFLTATDFYALSDVTISDEMKTYRQALRDITNGLDTVKKVNEKLKIKDGEFINFDSYMLAEDDLMQHSDDPGKFRLLEVDNRVVLPVQTHIRVVVTAADVLHCWAIPSLGVKLDACPGRLNQTSLFIKREGVFYGQCSEICGVNHGFMPIVVVGESLENYSTWISDKLADL